MDDDAIRVKQEILPTPTSVNGIKPSVIDLCSSDEEDNDGIGASRAVGEKRARSGDIDTPAKRVAVEEGIGQSSSIVALQATPCNVVRPSSSSSSAPSCKQFWKAGDYEGTSGGHWEVSAGGFDHVRVHPKFLHSNATSHKWALGAFAELLDNALDEVHSGATYVNVNMLNNKKDGSRMLLIEDNGGGMNPEKMRHCMSLGYSAKSKLANTIGQYGNGFKTSTMRLGADVIVFSRCPGKDGDSFTQTIGLLSYTFLKSTGKEDIVVPMLDYERDGSEWSPIVRSSVSDWNKNVDTIVQWSPFSTEDELLCQFNLMKEHGTRIIIYNLWEDDQGLLELDFDTDPHDIQLRGVNRDEKSISMAAQYPNSRHFLTYRHSLRSYVSILYLRVPPEFRIILRGRDVEHHNIVNDMMHTNQITYRPKEGPGGQSNFSNLYSKDLFLQILFEELAQFLNMMSAVVTIGFVKDAKHHVDVQGFNVYHKNRLIKPFWRIWNAAGSQGRGIIGVLEADFVEPAHDKQGFERTTVLSRLETRLLVMQKNYWRLNCHRIGYVSAHGKKSAKDSEDRESSPEYAVSTRKRAAAASLSFKTPTAARTVVNRGGKGKGSVRDSNGVGSSEKSGKHGNTSSKFNGRAKARVAPPAVEDINSDEDSDHDPPGEENVTEPPEKSFEPPAKPRSADSRTLSQLEQENETLKERLNKKEAVYLLLQEELRREKELRKKLEAEVQRTKDELEDVKKEQESLIDIFSEDRDRRDKEEEDLRNKLEEASNTIQALRGRR
ncbi:hypothetical protein HID58_051651 [Brassica napus]|uniref:Morc S5 domain-containing protein n=3 Tax=Brassica TaxID=3705 RepID=A0ABQ8AA80_BRANA|nr:hypothetical protein HID58_051651 [Brassica napus]CDY45818.1 BnaC03g16410D [Brassica napus]VDC88420.1 unnamed protein product [Brassica oleracea]